MKNSITLDLTDSKNTSLLKVQEILKSCPINSFSPPLHSIPCYTNNKDASIQLKLDGKKASYFRHDEFKTELFNFSGEAKVEGFPMILIGTIFISLKPDLADSPTVSFHFDIGEMKASFHLYYHPNDEYIIDGLTNYRSLAEELRRLAEAGEITEPAETERSI